VPASASRRLAANLLEAQLLRLARAGAVIERRLGPGLVALSAPRLYRRLGFVRLGDYLTERLGMRLRRCQSIIRLERTLGDLPAVAAAFDAGALPPSKVRIVASAATPATQELWLARAQRLTVRDLQAAVRVSRQAQRPEETDPAPLAAGRDGLASTAPTAATDAAPEDEPGVLISFAAPGRAFALWHWALEFVRRVAGRQEPAWRCAEYLAAEFLSGCPDVEDPAGLSGSVDPENRAQPTGSADLEDRARPTGSDNPGDAAQTFEAAASESAPPAAPAEGDPSPASGPLGRPPRPAISDEEVWARAVAAVRDALQSLGSAADLETILSAPPPTSPQALPESIRAGAPRAAPEAPPGPIPLGTPPSSPQASDPDPWDLDARLRGFVRLRQSLAWRQGRLLAAVAASDLHRDLGYDSLGDWCQHVLGMSPRRARYLVSLDRRLDRLPLVADAYRRGLVSWCQARLLIRVARLGTESRWVRYARGVTVRRLEDVVTACAVTAADRALGRQVRTAQDGAPLPPSEPLPRSVPSSPTEPRCPPHPLPARHMFAPDTGDALTSAGAVPAVPAPQAAARHMFAPGADDAPASSDDVRGPARHMFAPEPCAHRIAFWAPLDVATVWRSAIRACRRSRGPRLRDWECLLIFIIEMRHAWQPHENAEWRRRYRVLERDGWRCRAPGCTSRSHLNAHHVEFRSQFGSDQMTNLVTLCIGHHQAGVHENRIRCYGQAPEAIWWELGIRPDAPPLVRYFGERIVGVVESRAGRRARERPLGATDHGAADRANGDGTAERPAVNAPGLG
jgi:hypothetical protein